MEEARRPESWQGWGRSQSLALFRGIVILGGDEPRVVAAVSGYIHVAEDERWQWASFDYPRCLQGADVNG